MKKLVLIVVLLIALFAEFTYALKKTGNFVVHAPAGWHIIAGPSVIEQVGCAATKFSVVDLDLTSGQGISECVVQMYPEPASQVGWITGFTIAQRGGKASCNITSQIECSFNMSNGLYGCVEDKTEISAAVDAPVCPLQTWAWSQGGAADLDTVHLELSVPIGE